MIIEYTRLRDSVRHPDRAHPSDAGLDVFYAPPEHVTQKDADIQLSRYGSAMIPTGLRFGIPHGYMLEVKNRSSIAAKRSLIVGACVVDSGYDGEVFIDVHNIGREKQIISPGDKIAQLVLIPVVHFRARENPLGNLYDSMEPIAMGGRSFGALGSTNDFYGAPMDLDI